MSALGRGRREAAQPAAPLPGAGLGQEMMGHSGCRAGDRAIPSPAGMLWGWLACGVCRQGAARSLAGPVQRLDVCPVCAGMCWGCVASGNLCSKKKNSFAGQGSDSPTSPPSAPWCMFPSRSHQPASAPSMWSFLALSYPNTSHRPCLKWEGEIWDFKCHTSSCFEVS